MQGMFITLEGIEGSGKTTQIPNIAAYLQQHGHNCLVTREPGATAVGRKIRAILLDPAHKDLDALAELLLYAADRAQHVREALLPSLEAGKTVICDRFHDATVAYQGFARGLDKDFIDGLHRMILKDLEPHLTLLLDLPVEVGLSRAWQQIDNGSRAGEETRFEEEDLAFHEKVRAGYLHMARHGGTRFRVIDASGDVSDVRRSIIEVLSQYE